MPSFPGIQTSKGWKSGNTQGWGDWWEGCPPAGLLAFPMCTSLQKRSHFSILEGSELVQPSLVWRVGVPRGGWCSSSQDGGGCRLPWALSTCQVSEKVHFKTASIVSPLVLSYPRSSPPSSPTFGQRRSDVFASGEGWTKRIPKIKEWILDFLLLKARVGVKHVSKASRNSPGGDRLMRQAAQPKFVPNAVRGRPPLGHFPFKLTDHFMLTTWFTFMALTAVVLLGARFKFLFNVSKSQGHLSAEKATWEVQGRAGLGWSWPRLERTSQ